MKNIVKLLMLGAMTLGALVGCDDKDSSNITTSQDATSSSQITTSDTSSSSVIPSSDSHSSAISSSSSSSTAPLIIGLALNTDNAKTDYKYGDTFDTTGLVVNALYSDNTNLPIDNYSIDLTNGTVLNEHGTKKVTVTYETFTADYTITVSAVVTDLGFGGIYKARYAPGEKLDLSGLIVSAIYSDGSVELHPNYTSDPENGTVLTEVGTHRINITYKGFTKGFLISVRVPRELRLNTENVKLTYEQGEVLDTTGLAVVVNYSDNSNEDVTEFTTNPVNGTVLNEIGTFDVTVSALNLTATYQIVVNKATKKNWTDEETKTMSDNLYGVVLPYTGYEESVVTYSSQYKTVYINGGAADKDTLVAYASALTTLGFESKDQKAYIFLKTVETVEGTRYVKVVFYADEDNNFYLEAYDPYVYSFPVDTAKYFAYQYGSEIVVPAFEADRYEINNQDNAIYCYKVTETAESDYTALLNAANWDTTGGVESQTGFYTAISPDKNYMVYYKYFADNLHSLDIYFLPVNFWNDEPIKAFYAKYTDYTIDIPALNVPGAGYLFQESALNESAYAAGQLEFVHAFMYVIGGTEANLAPYKTTLINNGWSVTGEGTSYEATKAVGTTGLARIEFGYDRTVGVIVTFYAKLEPFPLKGWPYEQIATILGNEVTDTIPAYTADAKGYTVLDDAFGTAIVVEVEKGTENACISTYKTILESNGYTLVSGTTADYLSPNKQIYLSIYMGTSGSFTIEFSRAPYYTWPTEKIATMLNELFGEITETLPAYTSGKEYTVEAKSGDLYITVTLPSSIKAADALTAYVAILKTNNFTEVGEDADGDVHYLSQKQQLDVCPYVQSNKLVIYVTSLDLPEKWPQTAINTFWSAMKFTDVLPEYDGEYVSATAEADTVSLTIVVTLAQGADVEAAYDGYRYLLVTSKFSYSQELPFGMGIEYLSENKQFTVVVTQLENGFQLTIEEAEKDPVTGDGFPMADILEYFPQAENVLPALNGGIDYEFEGYTGWCGVMVTFESKTIAESKYDAYIQALLDAGFTAREVWGGYTTGYFSPDGTFTILVTEYFSQNGVYVDVYDPDIAYF